MRRMSFRALFCSAIFTLTLLLASLQAASATPINPRGPKPRLPLPPPSSTFDCCLEVGLIPELMDPEKPSLGWGCDTSSLDKEALKKYNDCREHWDDPVITAMTEYLTVLESD